jgi:hypothetical protein
LHSCDMSSEHGGRTVSRSLVKGSVDASSPASAAPFSRREPG